MSLTIGKIILLAVLALIVVLAIALRGKIQAGWLATRKFFREVRIEMQKVSWPTRNDIIAQTVVVLVAVIALSAAITAWDQVLSWIVRWIIPGGGA